MKSRAHIAAAVWSLDTVKGEDTLLSLANKSIYGRLAPSNSNSHLEGEFGHVIRDRNICTIILELKSRSDEIKSRKSTSRIMVQWHQGLHWDITGECVAVTRDRSEVFVVPSGVCRVWPSTDRREQNKAAILKWLWVGAESSKQNEKKRCSKNTKLGAITHMIMCNLIFFKQSNWKWSKILFKRLGLVGLISI